MNICNCLFLLFCLPAMQSVSQERDYCRYFSFDVSEITLEGKQYKSSNPVVLRTQKDAFGRFLREHSARFEYLLFKQVSESAKIAEYYPDTSRIRIAYCEQIIQSKSIQGYFHALTPKKLGVHQPATDTFSLDELMLTASKFFYCDAVDPKDTTVQSHICIGINGQNEFKSERDLTLLEAFSYEAIFHYLMKRKEPVFYSEFDASRRKAAREKLAAFRDFESYLKEVRMACYTEMQHNGDLKKKLLAYYEKNRENLSFVIQ